MRTEKLETLLSLRDYRADVLVDVALIRVAGEGPSAAAVAEALRAPAYALYFGRKSCPLGLPLRPIRVDGVPRVAGLFAILDETFGSLDADAAEPIADVPAGLRRAYDPDSLAPAPWPVYADADLGGDGAAPRDWPDMLSADYEPLRAERRRDRVASRRRWQFELRDEIVARPRPEARPEEVAP